MINKCVKEWRFDNTDQNADLFEFFYSLTRRKIPHIEEALGTSSSPSIFSGNDSGHKKWVTQRTSWGSWRNGGKFARGTRQREGGVGRHFGANWGATWTAEVLSVEEASNRNHSGSRPKRQWAHERWNKLVEHQVPLVLKTDQSARGSVQTHQVSAFAAGVYQCDHVGQRLHFNNAHRRGEKPVFPTPSSNFKRYNTGGLAVGVVDRRPVDGPEGAGHPKRQTERQQLQATREFCSRRDGRQEIPLETVVCHPGENFQEQKVYGQVGEMFSR